MDALVFNHFSASKRVTARFFFTAGRTTRSDWGYFHDFFSCSYPQIIALKFGVIKTRRKIVPVRFNLTL